jgi:hypothetical protein
MNSKFHMIVVASLVVGLMAEPAVGQGLSWNARGNFSLVANPNGAWSYGSKSFPMAAGLCLYSVQTCGWNHPAAGACASPTCWPYVNVGSTPTTLEVHPKTSATVRYSTVRWTAPFSGTFLVAGQFAGQAGAPSLSCNVAVVLNGSILPGIGGTVLSTATFPFNVTLAMTAGSTLDFTVGDGGNGDFQDHCLLSASITAQCRLEFTCPTGPGSITVRNSGCTPNGTYVTAITLNQGAFPNGPFFGIGMTLAEVVSFLSLGPPFFGPFNANGESVFTFPAGVPPGITLYAVTVDANLVLLVPISLALPVTFTTC